MFVGTLIGVPVLLLFALSTLKIVPLEVTRVDAEGNETKQSIFSSEGMAGLGDMLTGNKKAPKPEANRLKAVARPPPNRPGGTLPRTTAPDAHHPWRGLSG